MDLTICTVFLSFLALACSVTVFHSRPFTAFRHECPHNSGVVKLSMQMYENSRRKDVVFTTICGDIKSMFPPHYRRSRRRHKRQIEQEEEDCRWSIRSFNPAIDNTLEDTCSGVEYMAGISRRIANKLEFLCCRLPDRELEECKPFLYPLPTKDSPVVQVYLKDSVIASIKLKDGLFTAVFCKIMLREEEEEDFAPDLASLLGSSIPGAPPFSLSGAPLVPPFLPALPSVPQEKELDLDTLDNELLGGESSESRDDAFLRLFAKALFSDLKNELSETTTTKKPTTTTSTTTTTTRTTTTTTPSTTTTTTDFLSILGNEDSQRTSIVETLNREIDITCNIPRGSTNLRDHFGFCRCFLKMVMATKDCNKETISDTSLLTCLRLLTIFERYSLGS